MSRFLYSNYNTLKNEKNTTFIILIFKSIS